MNQITLHNYEAFFLDFIEGKLDDSSMHDFLSFLKNHPELKSSLEEYADFRIIATDQVFSDKEALKKMDFTISVNPENFHERCIAYYENLLNEQQTTQFLQFLELHPQFQNDFRLFGAVQLKENQKLIYPGKSVLKHRRIGLFPYAVVLKWTGVAASVVLAVTLYMRSGEDKSSVSMHTTKNQTKNFITSHDKPEKYIRKKVYAVNDRVNAGQTETSSIEKTIDTEDQVRDTASLPYLDAKKSISLATLHIERPTLEIIEPEIIESYQEDPDYLSYTGKILRKNLKIDEVDQLKKKINLWNLASITLKGFNRLTENDLKLSKETDKNGKITAFAIETPNRKYGFSYKN